MAVAAFSAGFIVGNAGVVVIVTGLLVSGVGAGGGATAVGAGGAVSIKSGSPVFSQEANSKTIMDSLKKLFMIKKLINELAECTGKTQEQVKPALKRF